MNTAIRTVVPQPGATFPYSEFNGFSAVPSAVTFPWLAPADFTFDVVPVAISYFFLNLIRVAGVSLDIELIVACLIRSSLGFALIEHQYYILHSILNWILCLANREINSFKKRYKRIDKIFIFFTFFLILYLALEYRVYDAGIVWNRQKVELNTTQDEDRTQQHTQ